MILNIQKYKFYYVQTTLQLPFGRHLDKIRILSFFHVDLDYSGYVWYNPIG